MTLSELATPSLLLDRARLERNLAAMARHTRNLGVSFRPHLKTAKNIEIARLALAQSGTFGITVSTLAEAEYFAAEGITDVFYAVGVEPGKFQGAAALIRRGVSLRVATHDVRCAQALAETAVREGVEFAALIEIDSGAHRGGVTPTASELLALAAALHQPGRCQLAGVFTHGGHSYQGRTASDHAEVARDEATAVEVAAWRIREAGFPCPTLSIGSTPTIRHAETLGLVTEARAGVYMFADLFQVGIEAAKEDSLALTVLTAVIGTQPVHNRLLIDAGALALSDDRSTRALGEAKDLGYGRVCDLDGVPSSPELFVHAVSQEHGWVTSREPIDFTRFPLGTRLRVQPNHACTAAAGHSRYQVLDDDGYVRDEWKRCAGL